MDDLRALSDEQLRQLAFAGNADAEELLIKKYTAAVRAMSRPYFLAGGDSEDLIQEGMLGLISAIRTYDTNGGASFRTYSELCIKRRLLSAIRNASKGKSISLDDCLPLESPLFDESSNPAVMPLNDVSLRGPEQLIIDREETDKLFSSFTGILSRFEANVLRYYLKGMSYREIADALDKQDKAVDNAVQRIRRKLAQFHKTHSDSGIRRRK